MTYPDILDHASNVISKQVNLRTSFYDRNRISLFYGTAGFVDNHTIAITKHDGRQETITADTIVIATGSRPYHPADIDFDHHRVYDSDTILWTRKWISLPI